MTPRELPPITAEHMPPVDSIRWEPAPTGRPERLDPRGLAALDHDELLAFVFSLQDDVEALRITLHEALHALSTVMRERDRLRAALRGRPR